MKITDSIAKVYAELRNSRCWLSNSDLERTGLSPRTIRATTSTLLLMGVTTTDGAFPRHYRINPKPSARAADLIAKIESVLAAWASLAREVS